MNAPPAWSTAYDAATDAVVFRLDGKAKAAVFIAALDRIFEEHDSRSTRIFWDLRETDFSEFNLSEIKTLAAYREQLSGQRRHARSCILISHKADHPLVKLFIEMNAGSRPATPVFLEESEAWSYLTAATQE